MQRFQKWDLSRDKLKNFVFIFLLLSASAIALHVFSISAGSDMTMQLALNGESEFVSMGGPEISKNGTPSEDTTVNLSLANSAILSNTVEILTDQTGAFSDKERPLLRSAPILTINKDDDPPDNVQPGAMLTYAITYSNMGNIKATGVIIIDTFDNKVTFEESWPSPTDGTGNVRYWQIGDLHKRDHGNITATVIVSTSTISGTVLSNLVQIDSPDAEMASSTETTTVISGNRYMYLPMIFKSHPMSIFEGFEAGVVPPPGWTLIQTNPNQTWKLDTVQLTPHSGSYYASVKYDPALLDQDELLLSPAFTADIGYIYLWSFGSLYWCRDTYDNCNLEVWFINGSWGGGDDVLLGKTDDDWTGEWEWSYSTFDFSPYTSGNPARIALRYVGNDGAKIGVDDIIITYYPP